MRSRNPKPEGRRPTRCDGATARLAGIFHTFVGAPINTAALARCKDALSLGELFQQFVARDKKPLKRLVGRSSRLHRAKAPVLIRMGVTVCEICTLEEGRSQKADEIRIPAFQFVPGGGFLDCDFPS